MNDNYRNHGCRIHRNIKINDIDSIILENEKLRITILVEKGADITEFLYKPKDVDVMFKSPRGMPEKRSFYTETYDDTFQSIYEGGWQEVFPSASGGGNYKGANFPFHGESFYRKWDCDILKDTEEEISVKFTLSSQKLPLILERTMTLKTNESCVCFDEKITNYSEEEVDFMWGHHPAVGGKFLDESVVMHIPAKKTNHLRGSFGEGAVVKSDENNSSWPVMERASGGTIDMSKVLPKNSKERAMIILSELEKGEYLIYNNNLKVGFGMEWDKEVMPFVWLWANYNGERTYPWFGRAYAVAVEPFSSRVETGIDSLNETIGNKTALKIGGGDTITFKMKAFIKDEI